MFQLAVLSHLPEACLLASKKCYLSVLSLLHEDGIIEAYIPGSI